MPVPKIIQVRLPDDLREALAQFMGRTGTDLSTAVRMNLRTALGQPIRDAAIKEGISEGVAAIRKRLGGALDAALSDLGVK